MKLSNVSDWYICVMLYADILLQSACRWDKWGEKILHVSGMHAISCSR